jgi:hypothetical protein
MIEKIRTKYPDFDDLKYTVNQLVDAVNNQQIQLNNHECRLLDLHSRITALDDPTYHEEPADPYAEQRRWIGCLVEYGNADDGFRYGILTNIEPRYSAYPFEIDNGRDATADCWLPSKTIFYKGGDNDSPAN